MKNTDWYQLVKRDEHDTWGYVQKLEEQLKTLSITRTEVVKVSLPGDTDVNEPSKDDLPVKVKKLDHPRNTQTNLSSTDESQDDSCVVTNSVLPQRAIQNAQRLLGVLNCLGRSM